MTTIWSISDLHLSNGTPEKNMGTIFPIWQNYMTKIAYEWDAIVQETDIVLIPGDISWAMNISEANDDLAFLAERPGTKILTRGNHDYWWTSNTIMNKRLPTNIYFIHNTSVVIANTVGIIGAKSYNVPGSDKWFMNDPACNANKIPNFTDRDLQLFNKECLRLKTSAKHLQNRDMQLTHIIAMLHYPPCSPMMAPSVMTDLLTRLNVNICVFGHLHFYPQWTYSTLDNITYHLVAADYLQFKPKKILEF